MMLLLMLANVDFFGLAQAIDPLTMLACFRAQSNLMSLLTSGGALALGPPILEIEPRCAATPGKKLRGELVPS